MGQVLSRQELVKKLAAEPAIVRAALEIVAQSVRDYKPPCPCETAKDVLSRGHYDAGGSISEECMGSDDPEQCEEDRRQRHQQWNNLKSRVENGMMDFAEGKIRDAFNIRPGAIAAMQGRGAPAGAALAAEEGAGALGAGAALAEEGGAALEGLAGLARFLPMLMI